MRHPFDLLVRCLIVAKGGFDRIAGAYALPMLGWKVEECHEFLAVLLQAQRRIGVFGFIGFDE